MDINKEKKIKKYQEYMTTLDQIELGINDKVHKNDVDLEYLNKMLKTTIEAYYIISSRLSNHK